MCENLGREEERGRGQGYNNKDIERVALLEGYYFGGEDIPDDIGNGSREGGYEGRYLENRGEGIYN